MQPEHEREFELHKDPFTKILWLMNVVTDTTIHFDSKISKETRIHLADVREGLERLFLQLKEMKVEGWERTYLSDIHIDL